MKHVAENVTTQAPSLNLIEFGQAPSTLAIHDVRNRIRQALFHTPAGVPYNCWSSWAPCYNQFHPMQNRLSHVPFMDFEVDKTVSTVQSRPHQTRLNQTRIDQNETTPCTDWDRSFKQRVPACNKSL